MDKKKMNSKRERTSKKYCPDCKFRIRGENHNEGNHHKGISMKRR